ncbi:MULTISPECIES: ABC transporter ATP-binding protein [Pseudonocardia]|uniref:Oligopeptide transport ATP-binding protein OppD n=2 Tax=Pseudonocardia TaxID=1847 RepID=A0A1Y2MM52_PSEAH|nr:MULTISPECIES: ABC transporter ATP-binding protein [Pseudonocardia]OSY35737.1 Oligopeptide transport ATP-binding protein OppD [Pseudonocardia autotrophica]TDN74571.1 oligopeptide transport system ATP-binding protein [Pseudonocardia autotrophica]BBG05339.1 ABC transporter ATP-binding protein [Pseudonocardia autotrophica]GEC27463.1 ABC transporter ATP-binding protein [Pseudonocardia saturnea]
MTAPSRPAGEPLLSVRGLTIDLPGEPGQRGLVEDVTFDVHRGRSLALIGESGCGKSLTSMAVLRLLPPGLPVRSGSVHFDGVDLLRCRERELRSVRGGPVGIVFQEPMSSLNPTMTVGDQIAEARRLHLGESRRTAHLRAAELLDRVGIPNAAQRVRSYPHELSGGMQQRVMIAGAIACDPRLVIADEPTTALDVTIQAEILQLLRDLQRDMDLAVLLVTHDLGVVADFCDDVVVMYAGHVVERTSIDGLFYDPQHPYSSALLAAVPQSGSPRTRLNVIPGRVPPAGRFPDGCRFRPRCGHGLPEQCALPQVDTELEHGHRTRCGRVSGGELTLEGVARV